MILTQCRTLQGHGQFKSWSTFHAQSNAFLVFDMVKMNSETRTLHWCFLCFSFSVSFIVCIKIAQWNQWRDSVASNVYSLQSLLKEKSKVLFHSCYRPVNKSSYSITCFFIPPSALKHSDFSNKVQSVPQSQFSHALPLHSSRVSRGEGMLCLRLRSDSVKSSMFHSRDLKCCAYESILQIKSSCH